MHHSRCSRRSLGCLGASVVGGDRPQSGDAPTSAGVRRGDAAIKHTDATNCHLLRQFVSFSERDGPAGAFGRELLDCTALVFESLARVQ